MDRRQRQNRVGTNRRGGEKEGQVNVSIGGWGAVLESGVFEQSYPGIKVVAVAGRGGETAKRILAQRRAGKFIADVSSEGVGSNYRTLHAANSFDPIKPVLLDLSFLDQLPQLMPV